MYADRHVEAQRIKPASLAAAVAINAAVIGALMVSAPVLQIIKDKRPLTIFTVPETPPPPPLVPEIKPRVDDRVTAAIEQVSTSAAILPGSADTYVLLPPLPVLPPLPLPAGEATVIDPPPPAPVLADARLDPRYARDLQPTYPAGERRAEREGTATVRVTIGTDGRVTNAECVVATSDAFCRATRVQALSKWRFQPATRDGVPMEASKVMTVRFELQV